MDSADEIGQMAIGWSSTTSLRYREGAATPAYVYAAALQSWSTGRKWYTELMTQLSFQLFLEVCIQQKRAAVHDGFFLQIYDVSPGENRV
jgi:hypothetical protein